MPWWEVEAADGEVLEPPARYPADVEVVAFHAAKVTILRLQAGSRAGAVARVEEMLGTSGGKWTVRPVPAGELIMGR